MEIFLAVIILIISFILLIWGGDKFVNASISLARKFKIPPAIIGATITSIGTTLPELLVTIFASTGESANLAVGNALGSIAFNGALIGGILLIFSIISLKETGKSSAILLIFSIILTLIMSFDFKIEIWECLILVGLFVIYMILNYLKAIKISQQQTESQKSVKLSKLVLMFIISATAIGVGAYFLVDKAKFLAGAIGMSETLIGLTIVAIGTSLPELITTINSLRKKESGLGLGNIIGSNIINCTLLMSLSGILGGVGLPVDIQTLSITLPIAIAITIILLLPTIIKGKTSKWQGFCLVGLYSLYYIYLILNGLNVIPF